MWLGNQDISSIVWYRLYANGGKGARENGWGEQLGKETTQKRQGQGEKSWNGCVGKYAGSWIGECSGRHQSGAGALPFRVLPPLDQNLLNFMRFSGKFAKLYVGASC